jgi:hypothetical protein
MSLTIIPNKQIDLFPDNLTSGEGLRLSEIVEEQVYCRRFVLGTVRFGASEK